MEIRTKIIIMYKIAFGLQDKTILLLWRRGPVRNFILGGQMLGITNRGVKMPNIQLNSSIFSSFMIFTKILGGSIDPLTPL